MGPHPPSAPFASPSPSSSSSTTSSSSSPYSSSVAYSPFSLCASACVSAAEVTSGASVSVASRRDFAALISGGKDSIYSIRYALALGHRLRCVAYLRPPASVVEADSFMYQSVGAELVADIARCMQVPLVVRTILGKPVATDSVGYAATKGDEVEDLFELLRDVQTRFPSVAAVSAGAILSDYQRQRVENVCMRLHLQPLFFLWHRAQGPLLREMAAWGLDAVLVKTAAWGLKAEHLGATIGALEKKLEEMEQHCGVQPCGEGGEYETIVVDCPLFREAVMIDKWKFIVHSPDDFAPVLLLQARRWHTAAKAELADQAQGLWWPRDTADDERGIDENDAEKCIQSLTNSSGKREKQTLPLYSLAAADAAKRAADKARCAEAESDDGDIHEGGIAEEDARANKRDLGEELGEGNDDVPDGIGVERGWLSAENVALSFDKKKFNVPCACRSGFSSHSACPACAFLQELFTLDFFLSPAARLLVARSGCLYTRALAQLASRLPRKQTAQSRLPMAPFQQIPCEGARLCVTGTRVRQTVLLHAVLTFDRDSKSREAAAATEKRPRGFSPAAPCLRSAPSSRWGAQASKREHGESQEGRRRSVSLEAEREEHNATRHRGPSVECLNKKAVCLEATVNMENEKHAVSTLASLIIKSIQQLRQGAETSHPSKRRGVASTETSLETKEMKKSRETLPIAHLLLVAFSPFSLGGEDSFLRESVQPQTPAGSTELPRSHVPRQTRQDERNEARKTTKPRDSETPFLYTPSDSWSMSFSSPSSSLPSSPSSSSPSPSSSSTLVPASGALLDLARLVQNVLSALDASATHPFPVTSLCAPAGQGEKTVPLLRLALELDDSQAHNETGRVLLCLPSGGSELLTDTANQRLETERPEPSSSSTSSASFSEGASLSSSGVSSFVLSETVRRFKEPFVTRSLNLWVPALTALPELPQALNERSHAPVVVRRPEEALKAGEDDAGREKAYATHKEGERSSTSARSFSLGSNLCQAATYTQHEQIWKIERQDRERRDDAKEFHHSHLPIGSSPSNNLPSVACSSMRCIATHPLPYSEILVGGISGHLPHTSLLPVFSPPPYSWSPASPSCSLACSSWCPSRPFASPACPASASSEAALRVSLELQREERRAAVPVEDSLLVCERSNHNEQGHWAGTTQEEKDNSEETKGDARLQEPRPPCDGLAFALEVAVAARNLVHTTRLAGAESAESEAQTSESEKEEEDGDDAGEEFEAGEHERRQAGRHARDRVHLTTRLPAPPPLLFAFSSLREAPGVSEFATVKQPWSSLEGQEDGGRSKDEKISAKTAAARRNGDARLGKRAEPPAALDRQANNDFQSTASSAVASLLAGVRSQLEIHLNPQGVVSWDARTRVERRAKSLSREGGEAGETRRQPGHLRAPEPRACVLCSSEDVPPASLSVSSCSFFSSLCSLSPASSSSSLSSRVLCRRCVGAPTLVVPAQVSGVQGGGHLSLWPLGVRGECREFSRTETRRVEVQRSCRGSQNREDASASDMTAARSPCPFVSASWPRCTDSAENACEEAGEPGEGREGQAAEGRSSESSSKEIWSLWISGGRARGRWVRRATKARAVGENDTKVEGDRDVGRRGGRKTETDSQQWLQKGAKEPKEDTTGVWKVELNFSARLEGNAAYELESETRARSGELRAIWAAAVVTAAKEASRDGGCLRRNHGTLSTAEGERERGDGRGDQDRCSKAKEEGEEQTEEREASSVQMEENEEALSVLVEGVVDAVLTLDRWTRQSIREHVDSGMPTKTEREIDFVPSHPTEASQRVKALAEGDWCLYVLYVPRVRPLSPLSSSAASRDEGDDWEEAFRRLFFARVERLLSPEARQDSSTSPRLREDASPACRLETQETSRDALPKATFPLVFVPVLGLEQTKGCAPTRAQVVVVRDRKQTLFDV
ncbi:ATP-binding domain-containing protein [Toxoplasma gondii VEG]|uniref:Diphthine--ammonia ligase n=2 Tax=Toxoplasma gondii TaxID=5811 RepID=V4ZL18_TOXGV|nr:ATP-binding domain-containing protein [Toxoplasma gondii VEG]KFG45957.1 ATP-binding domain-containing protein [Toxoplasma gondii p89]CEL73858.1 TPA: ATP-binding domain-containing protein 4 [Toxoplasma gondii VEG]